MAVKTFTANPKTLDSVREEIRGLLSSGQKPEAVTVNVLAGVYRPEQFVFTKEDCSPDCRVSYLAEPGAVISGGVQLTKELWKTPDDAMAERFSPDAREHIRMADLSAAGVTAGDWGVLSAIGAYETSMFYDNVPTGHGSEVFCGKKNGDTRRMTLARYPDKGTFARLDRVMDVGDVHEFPEQNYFRDWDDRRNQRGGTYVLDKAVNARVSRWKKDDEIWMFGYFYHDWADASTPVTFDCEHRLVFPRYVARYGAKAGALYYFYNVPEELDTPDEWYLDRKNGKLYFYPREDDDLLELSFADMPLISCTGTVNMTFSGFSLRCTMRDAVVSSGDDMIFSHLTVTNVAGNAIRSAGCRCLVSGCDISHTGRGGIIAVGGDRATLTSGKNRVTENYIHDFSEIYLTYQPGISVSGVGALCDHNEISNSPHMAIGYSGNEHVIEYNDIHDVVLQSGDAGAIYAGFDWAANGTVIRYNRLRHIGDGEFRPDGIYWDDGLSGQTAYGNLLIDVRKNGFLAGGGRENHIDNNVLIDCATPISYDDRNRDGFLHGGWAHAACDTPDAPHWKHLEAQPIHSPVWAEKYPLLAKVSTDFSDPENPDFPINPAYSTVKGNVIIHAEGKFGWCAQSVYDYSEVSDNPVFRTAEEAGWNAETGAFADGSPVYETLPGFSPIPLAKIGRHSDK